MCLENAQILSSVMFNLQLPRLPVMPKPYNPNHPVIRKIDNQAKLNWVLIYNSALQREYIFRFEKMHAYNFLAHKYMKILYKNDAVCNDLSFAAVFKDFTAAKPCIVEAYRSYYCYKHRTIRDFCYTKRPCPTWLI